MQVASLMRKPECDEETAKAKGKKTDLADSIPRCYQSEHGDGRRRSSAPIANQQFNRHDRARLERYLVGTQKFTLRSDYQEHLEMNSRQEILARAKANLEQGIAGVQKGLSILRDHNGRRWEECRLEGRGQRFAPGDCRDAFLNPTRSASRSS